MTETKETNLINSQNREAIIKFIDEMIDLLTIKRVIMLAVYAVLMAISLIVFENRSQVFFHLYDYAHLASSQYDRQAQIDTWELSNDSKLQLQNLLVDPMIAGVILSTVDLKRNEKTVKYHHFRDIRTNQVIASVLATSQAKSVFTEDKQHIQQMLLVLQNEFACYPYEDTNIFLLAPTLKEYKAICRLSVPPFFGEFVGYITIGLTRLPTVTDVDNLRILINKVSVDIYFRDIEKIKSPAIATK